MIPACRANAFIWIKILLFEVLKPSSLPLLIVQVTGCSVLLSIYWTFVYVIRHADEDSALSVASFLYIIQDICFNQICNHQTWFMVNVAFFLFKFRICLYIGLSGDKSGLFYLENLWISKIIQEISSNQVWKHCKCARSKSLSFLSCFAYAHTFD